jgi:hypothetical protein
VNTEPDWSGFAAALLDPRAPSPAGLRAWNGSDPGRRFAVHRNTVVVSLVAALAATFPVVRELVGGEFFQAMAGEFVRATPPASPVLAEYGEAFPDFVAAFPPAAGLPYLADVARLEWLRLQAFHAADAPALAADSMGSLAGNPEAVAGWRLRKHPATGLLRSPYAAFSLWAAHQGSDAELALAAVDPSLAEDVLVVRPGLEVRAMALAPGGYAFFAALFADRTLAEAAQEASLEAPRFDLAENLALMLREGAAGARSR